MTDHTLLYMSSLNRHPPLTHAQLKPTRLTADKSIGAALRAVEGSLHAGLEGLRRAVLLRVHGVDGAGRQGLGLAHARVFGRGQLRGEGPDGGGGRSVLLGGQRQRLALRGREGAAALRRLGLLAVRLGLRERARVQARLAVGSAGRAFRWFGGNRRGHFDRRLGSSRLEE